MDRKIIGWAFTIVGGGLTLCILVTSMSDGDWGWVTDTRRLPRYMLFGPLALVGGLFMLNDSNDESKKR